MKLIMKVIYIYSTLKGTQRKGKRNLRKKEVEELVFQEEAFKNNNEKVGSVQLGGI